VFRKLSLTLPLLAAIVGTSSLAQTTTGDIGGLVTDPSGALIAGAKVTATNLATNVQTSTVSNSDGIYSIRFLQIGTYKITVTSNGFSTDVTKPFPLEVSQVVKINAQLAVGSESHVVVNGELTPILNTENGMISTTISESLINALPINGHNFTELTQFAPGVSIGDQNQFNGAVGSPNNSGERTQSFATLPNINGNHAYNNDYFIDGIENTDTGGNQANGFGEPIYDPSPEALQSVNLFTAAYPAEYGNANGGEIVLTLKDGTNQLHGSAFGYLQNYLMDANTFGNKRVLASQTANPRGQYTQTIFGGTIGGPVIIPRLFNGRNKLFFFGDYEGYRKPSGGVSTTSVVPNAWRGNTTSSSSADPSVSPLAGYAYFGGAVPQLYDSQNGFAPFNQTINGVAYQNLVPIRSSVAKYLFAHPELYPLPNQVGQGGADLIQSDYSGQVKSLARNDQFDIKTDWAVTDRDRLTVRYSQSDADDGQSRILAPVFFPNKNLFPYKGFGINYVRTISPAIVNEARIGFTRAHYNSIPTSNGAFGTTGNALVGIAFPNQTASGFTAQSFSENGAQGVSGVGTSAGTNTAVDNVFEYGDNLTILRGRHVFKMGGQILRYQTNFFAGGSYGGALGTQSYSGEFTGNPGAGETVGYDFADFLLGDASSLSIAATTGDFGSRQYRAAIFAQDSYKISPALTLTYGLRWQYTQPVYEVHNKISNLDLATGQFQLAGVGGNSRSLYKAVHDEFDPRFGFAWQVDPRIVVRGGFGLTTFMDYNALNHFGNAPFVASVGLNAVAPTAGSGGTPFATSAGFPAATGTNSNYTSWSPNLKPQLVPQFTFVTEYQLNNASAITLQYVGETGSRITDVRNANQWALVGVPTSAPFYNVAGKSTIAYTESEGNSNFNAAEVTYRLRPSQGLELTANYTYSKNLADTTGPITVNDISGTTVMPEDSNNIHGEYGPVGSDQRHQFNGTFVYTLPFGRGQRYAAGVNHGIDEFIGGWRVSGDAVLLSGFPLAIRAGSDSNYVGGGGFIRAHQYRKMKITGRQYGRIIGVVNGVPTLNQGPNAEVLAGAFGTDPSATHSNHLGAGTCNNTAATSFNQLDDGVCAYGIPSILLNGAQNRAPDFSDTAHIGTERAPAFRGADAALLKDFPIFRENTIEFTAHAYNVGNISSYNNPNVIINGGNNWGIVQSTRSQQRQLELELKYKF
jgi:hypothetical protein